MNENVSQLPNETPGRETRGWRFIHTSQPPTRSNTMKTSRFHPDLVTVLRTAALALLALLLCLLSAWSQSLNTTTTFQGTLNLEGAPANGTFDILYRVVATTGADSDSVSGPTHTNRSVQVSQGVFTTEIEIPPDAIDWPQRFLDLQIRPSGDGAFQSLAPRLPITPVPAALVADTARAVSAGAVTAAALGSNVITTASLADGAVTAAKVGDGQLLKSLNGLTDSVTLAGDETIEIASANGVITIKALPPPCGFFANCCWLLLGNNGTTPAPAQTVTSGAGHNFLGTLNNRPLELRVNKWRGLRLEPTSVNNAPNWLGGYGGNYADPSATGITIGGGGANGEPNLADVYFAAVPRYDTIGGGADNRVRSSSYATVGGGRNNEIMFNPGGGRGFYETIAGGATNLIEISAFASIGGGNENEIVSHSDHAAVNGGQASYVFESRWASIGGGLGNVQGFTPGGTIGGGITNVMVPGGGPFVEYAPTIGGGQENLILASGHAVIAGGLSNVIGSFSRSAAIGGGRYNLIWYLSPDAIIAGGNANTILWDSAESVIGGGGTNLIEKLSPAATIAGGQLNLIDENSPRTTIGGGVANAIDRDTPLATIGGGEFNGIERFSDAATIAGGRLNFIAHGSPGATISGGQSNRLNFFTDYSTISGGTSNEIGFLTTHSVIGGGQKNDISDDSNLATIGGGGENKIGAELQGATVGGGQWNDIGARAHHSTISGGAGNQIEPITESSVIAGGRLNLIEFAPNDAVNTIGGGHGNRIRTGEYATIPGGREAYALRYGQLAHASGSFASAGDAQTSTHVLRGTSTGTAPQELFLDEVSKLLTIPADSTYTFDIHVAGRSQTGASAGYKICGVIKNVGGTVSFVGTPVIPVVMEDVASWNVTVTADTANNSLAIQASGSLNTPVRWVATVRTTEVVFP